MTYFFRGFFAGGPGDVEDFASSSAGRVLDFSGLWSGTGLSPHSKPVGTNGSTDMDGVESRPVSPSVVVSAGGVDGSGMAGRGDVGTTGCGG